MSNVSTFDPSRSARYIVDSAVEYARETVPTQFGYENWATSDNIECHPYFHHEMILQSDKLALRAQNARQDGHDTLADILDESVTIILSDILSH